MRRSYIVSLTLLVSLSVAALIGVLAAGWAPVLGVELQGGVEVVLHPAEEVTDEQLDQAIEIIRSRVDALGVVEPDITRQGQQVVIQLPGVKDRQRAVDLIGQTAELRFRPVQFSFPADDPQARAGASDIIELLSGTAAIDDQLTPPADTEAGNAESSEEPAPADDAEPPTSVTPTAPPTTGSQTDASTTTAPSTTATTTTTVAAGADGVNNTTLVPETTIAAATPTTIAVAPPTTEFDLATAPTLEEIVTPPEEDLAEATVLLAGDVEADGSQFVYVLSAAQLTGEVVSDANATFQGGWVVLVDFNNAGADAFDAMAAANFGQQVAIVLDGVVASAPRINAEEFDGQAVISGNFTEREAKDLALVLRFGALPVEFEQDDVRTVSATLGEGTLEAGVIAGLVGLALVGIYMLLYYRLLGLVAVSSLAISGAILWSAIAWLGESQGLALTLAGATGIVVSIGVQVDSNIVYYERIKEEVKRGRAIRSAADSSFGDAFKTIIWADLASLIGAGVLYFLTTGTVRGFALFLGITTLIDIFVSYFFMRPLVVLIARKLVGENLSRLGMSAVREEVAS